MCSPDTWLLGVQGAPAEGVPTPPTLAVRGKLMHSCLRSKMKLPEETSTPDSPRGPASMPRAVFFLLWFFMSVQISPCLAFLGLLLGRLASKMPILEREGKRVQKLGEAV